MRRRRRFPLFSLVLVVLVGAGVGYLTFIDLDVPQRALSQVGETLSGFGQSLRLMSNSEAAEGFSFSDVPPEANATPEAAATDAPAAGAQEEAMPLLVNADNPVPDGYAPSDMVLMRTYCDDSIVYIKGSEIEGERRAVDALMRMFEAAIAEGVGNWQISAGYRSVKYQQTVWDNKVYEYRQQGLSSAQAQSATAKYVAKPGASEHHTGLAFDVTVPGESFPLTEQSKWLSENCWDYGFIIRYTEEKQDITGINAEPWHVRYVGQPHARIMRDENLCLEEYLEKY